MPNVGIYFNDSELAWIREQEEGRVRRLVQADMSEATDEDLKQAEEMYKEVEETDGLEQKE